MTKSVRILVVGTFDTKGDELEHICNVIRSQGGEPIAMDVSVLGDTTGCVALSKHDVAAAAGATIDQVSALPDEHQAMSVMSRGAAALSLQLLAEGRFDGLIALGGTMGTDLALDVASVLPLGLPKYIVSTVAFSPLIPPDRLAVDIQMILWAGGLYGLNSICKATLSQAAGAVVGAAACAEKPAGDRPIVGITSLGNACLRYIKRLKPELEARGFEAAIFHSTGMGGRAFENLIEQGTFVAVFDLCLQEITNEVFGSIVSSGAQRLEMAGKHGVPQIVAPGAADLLDLPSWQSVPDAFSGRPLHVHNKLISSLFLNPEERRTVATTIADKLGKALGPSHLILPRGGIHEWDRPGQLGHDAVALEGFLDDLKQIAGDDISVSETSAHINDDAFVDEALAVFDRWVESGIVTRGLRGASSDRTARQTFSGRIASVGAVEGSMRSIRTIDYHTAGEPVRLVPEVQAIPGATMAEKAANAEQILSADRRLLASEPRGHTDMFGAFLTEPVNAKSAFGVLFYDASDDPHFKVACGHGSIAVAAAAFEQGWVKSQDGWNDISLDVPAGVVKLSVEVLDGNVGNVVYRHVPSRVAALDVAAEWREKTVRADLVQAGPLVALLDVNQFGLRIERDSLRDLQAIYRELRAAPGRLASPGSNETPELILFIEEGTGADYRVAAFFADGALDRSPCGTGTSARLAQLRGRGRLEPGATVTATTALGSCFEARIGGEVENDGLTYVLPEIVSRAHMTGRHEFVRDERDKLGDGFFVW